MLRVGLEPQNWRVKASIPLGLVLSVPHISVAGLPPAVDHVPAKEAVPFHDGAEMVLFPLSHHPPRPGTQGLDLSAIELGSATELLVPSQSRTVSPISLGHPHSLPDHGLCQTRDSLLTIISPVFLY